MGNKLKYILLAVAALVVLCIGVIIYRMFFEFDTDEVKIYVREEAAKYTENPGAAYALIWESVLHILSSHYSTAMVLRSARATNTDKEQELVHAALAFCRSQKYLATPK